MEKNNRPQINDEFDFRKLECQYMLICNSYDPQRCSYSEPCEMRKWFRDTTENYVAKDCLRLQLETLE